MTIVENPLIFTALPDSAVPRSQPPRTGLLVTSPAVNDGARWVSGFSWRPEVCAPNGGIRDQFNRSAEPSDDDDAAWKPVNPFGADEQSFMPYAVNEIVSCSTLGEGGIQNETNPVRQRALDALLAVQSFRIEHELWTGTLAAAMSYPQVPLDTAAGLTDVTSGGAVDAAEAVGRVDKQLGACAQGRRFMIHMSPLAAAVAAAVGVIVPVPTGGYRTPAGTDVVIGFGYPGTGPDGAAADAGTEWIIGSPWVTTRLDEPVVIDVTEYRQNDYLVLAERVAAAYFDDCCRVAAQVDLTSAL